MMDEEAEKKRRMTKRWMKRRTKRWMDEEMDG